MRLHTLPARLLQLLAVEDGPISYTDLGERLDSHPGSIKRLADEMIDQGWLTTERHHRIFKFTINPDVTIEEGGTLGDWLNRNRRDHPAG
jgi:hypothetical protein